MGALTNSSHDVTLQNNSLDVYVQDQTSKIVDYYIGISKAVYTLAQPISIDDYDIVVTDSTGLLAGTYIGIRQGVEFFQARILSIATNTITLDTPCDYDFTVAATVGNGTPELNVDGSGTPVIASIGPSAGSKWDIVRIMGAMVHTGVQDDNKFGGITALTRGIVLRKSNGDHETIFNVKTNASLKLRCGSLNVTYSTKAPAGFYGTSFDRTFGGQGNNGVVMRLNGDLGETIQMVIQDDLTGLTSFRIVVQGHVVEE